MDRYKLAIDVNAECDCGMSKCDNGNYVKHDDHITIAEEQRKYYENLLEKERKNLKELLLSMKNGIGSVTQKKSGMFFVQVTLDKNTLDQIMMVDNT